MLALMIRTLQILVCVFCLSCQTIPENKNIAKVILQTQHPSGAYNSDTLPNGKKLLDNLDSGLALYYKEVVGSDTLKGGFITCYGIDDSMKYFYLRKGDTLHLLNNSTRYQSPWSLGTLEKISINF